ncbi:hypothetical protein ACRAWD_31135 [Caulobacter segnis]
MQTAQKVRKAVEKPRQGTPRDPDRGDHLEREVHRGELCRLDGQP